MDLRRWSPSENSANTVGRAKGHPMLQEAMRLLGQVLSLLFGSTGVFMLWASFYVPVCGAFALLFLAAGAAILVTSGRTG